MTRISPVLSIRVMYLIKFRRRLDLNKPVTLNDKILWLETRDYWNNELVRQCADKYRVRQYVEQAGCGELLNELYGVWKTPEEIEWEKLPDRFVLKLNTACGYNRVVLDKKTEDREALNAELRRWLKEGTSYWLNFAELQYRDAEPLILAERYIGSPEGELPVDYKFFCMNGKSDYVIVCVDREIGEKAEYYHMNRNWEKQPFTPDYFRNPDREIPKPPQIDKAFEIAEKLSAPFPFVRTDLFLLGDRIVFGELTFTPSAGLYQDRRPEADLKYGELLRLPGCGAEG